MKKTRSKAGLRRESPPVQYCGDVAYVRLDGEEISAYDDPDKAPKGLFKIVGNRIVQIDPKKTKKGKVVKK